MHLSHVRTARRSSRIRGWAAVALTVMTLTACSSSGSGSSTPSGKASGSTTSSGSSSTGASAALTAVTTRPDKIPVTTPIGKAIPAGKSVYYINCGAEGCSIFGKIVAQAGAELKWNVTQVPTDGSPGQIANAWQTAIRAKPFAIVTVGTALAQVNNYIKQASGAGIVVVGVGVPETSWPNVTWLGYTISSASGGANALAAYVSSEATKDGTKNPGVLFVNVPDFTVVNQTRVLFVKDMPKLCPSCKVSTLDIGFANITQAPAQIISYLRSHPNIHYVAYGADNFTAASDQIAAAGLKVKIVTGTPLPSTMTQLGKGTLSAVVSFPYVEVGYAAVDALARKAAGVPVLQLPVIPLWVVTKDTAPTGAFPYPVVADAVSQFKALWHVS